MDITEFHKFRKENGIPFLLCLSFLLQRAMNEIKEMKHRVIDSKLCSYDVILPAFTIAGEEGAYAFCDGVRTPVMLRI